MDNTARTESGNQASPRVAMRIDADGRHRQTRLSPRYCLVLALHGATQAVEAIREIIRLNRSELEWLSGNQVRQATRLHLRLRSERIYDLVTAFEAAGFDVVRVVSSGR